MKDTNRESNPNNEIRNTDTESDKVEHPDAYITGATVWLPLWSGATGIIVHEIEDIVSWNFRIVYAVDYEGDVFRWTETVFRGERLREFAKPVTPEDLSELPEDVREKIENIVRERKAHYRKMTNYGMGNHDETE